MTKHLIVAALAGCIGWAATGSTAMADPLYVEVRTAPRHYEEYPRADYEGHPVYYVDGHWYYQRGPRWVYYREEPRPLVEFRASPSYRHHHHVRHHEHRHHHHGR
jgi:hypothetical protein